MLSPRSLPARILRKLNHHRTTELYFVGFPKTGNTWMRYMLGRYVQLLCGLPRMPLFDGADGLGRCERFCSGPAMHFTHRPLLWQSQKASDLDYNNVIRPFAEKRVVLLVRHPLDALVSLWMQQIHRVKDGYTDALTDMIENPVLGIEKFFRFYELWSEYSGHVKEFMLVRYEDMRVEPLSAFADVLEFLAIPLHEELLQQAVAESDFENMKKVEMSGKGPSYKSSGLNIFASGDNGNADSLHVRRGQVGGYVDYLTPEEIGILQCRIDGRLPTTFGYSRRSD